MQRKRTAFTLVELLVVITIIGMLVGLLVPAVISAREAARRGQCINRLREMATATIHYESIRGQLPGWQNKAPLGNQNISWVVALFPYLGREDLWQDWRSGSGPAAVYDQVVCPSDMGNLANPAPMNYVANTALFVDRSNPTNSVTLERIPSPQRTVMISERVFRSDRRVGPWNQRNQNQLTFNWAAATTIHGLASQATGLSSNHGGIVNVAFADGHVETLPDDTSTNDYYHLAQ